MATSTLKTRIKHKNGSPSDWAQATNFVPLKGELIIYNDATAPKIKVGDGNTLVESLPFVGASITMNGAVASSPSFYAPTSAGTAGQVLKSNGSGAPTWAAEYSYTLPTATSSVLGGVKVGSNITVSSGTISLTKANVTAALGYTPPTSDTNTTYTFSTGDSNGCIKVVASTGSSANVAVKGLGSNAYTSTAYLPLAGGTVTGTLILSKTQDASGKANNKPALIIGGTDTTAHIEIDSNEIIAKTNGTTETILNLAETQGIKVGGAATITGNISHSASFYQNRNVGSAGTIVFHRNANHDTEMTTSSGTYSHVLKENGSADVGMIYFNIPYASARTRVSNGAVADPFTSLGNFTFRTYSINSATGARLSYYQSFNLPSAPADMAANKTYYAMYQTSADIVAATSKQYVMGISGDNGSVRYNSSVYTSGSVLYGACWNDYAEYRSQNETIKPGYITYCDDDGKLKKTVKRLQKYEGVVSDTFGFSIGETDDCKTPLAVSGRVLVYCDPEEEHFHSGDCVCAGPDGLAYRMTREEIIEFPDRIVGVVSEIPTYETWGTGNVEVNGRIWIKVK